MRVAICDDDAKSRQVYTELIKIIAEKQNLRVFVDSFETGEQLLFSLSDKKVPPDIVFLDILMPGVSGIDLGAQMKQAGFVGSIIYLTNSKDHMLSAFDVGAVNYVIKGKEYEDDRFEKVFKRAVKQVEKRKRKYILINGISEHRNIAIGSISHFEVNKHICIVHYGKDKRFEFISSLGKIENTLVPYSFIRVHKSFLVNCAAVEAYTFKQITLQNEALVPVGRKYSFTFRKAMEAFALDGITANNPAAS